MHIQIYLILVGLLFGALARADEIEIVTGVIPPYTFQENEQPRGLVVELVQAMAKHANHSGKIKFLPWKRALQEVENATDQPKLIIPLNRSPEREEQFFWVQEMYVDKTVLITHKNFHPLIENVEQAKRLKIGVLLGSPLEAQLKRLSFTEVEATVDEETNARKLQAGRIAVWHVARLVAPFVFERHAFSPKNLQYGPGLDENDLYLGGSRNLTNEQADVWREAFKKIKADGTYDAIVKKFTQN